MFITIVEERAVTAAARRLGASPSAISLQLSNLEATVGTKLIDRSSQRFSLTPAGEVFLPRAMRILDEVSAAAAALSDSNPASNMALKIAAIEDFDSTVVPVWLSLIKKVYPNLRFIYKSGPSHENHSALGNRAADIIVAVDTSDTADWVEEHPILTDPYVLVQSSNSAPFRTPEMLTRSPMVRYLKEQFIGRQIEAQLRRNKIHPAIGHEFSSNQSVFSMVEATKGWAITTLSATLECKNRLTISKLPFAAFSRTICLYVRRDSLGGLPVSLARFLRQAITTELSEHVENSTSSSARPPGFTVLRSFE